MEDEIRRKMSAAREHRKLLRKAKDRGYRDSCEVTKNGTRGRVSVDEIKLVRTFMEVFLSLGRKSLHAEGRRQVYSKSRPIRNLNLHSRCAKEAQ